MKIFNLHSSDFFKYSNVYAILTATNNQEVFFEDISEVLKKIFKKCTLCVRYLVISLVTYLLDSLKVLKQIFQNFKLKLKLVLHRNKYIAMSFNLVEISEN